MSKITRKHISYINKIMRLADKKGGFSIRGPVKSLSSRQQALVEVAQAVILKGTEDLSIKELPQEQVDKPGIVSSQELSPKEQQEVEEAVLELMRQIASPEKRAEIAVAFRKDTGLSLPELVLNFIADQEAGGMVNLSATSTGINQPLLNPKSPLDMVFIQYFKSLERTNKQASLYDLVIRALLTSMQEEVSDVDLFRGSLERALNLPGAFNLQTLKGRVLDPRTVLSSSNAMQTLGSFFGANDPILGALSSGAALEYPLLVSFFRSFMKAELHAHTSGSVPAETIIELGRDKEYIDWSKLNQAFGANIRHIIANGDVQSLKGLIEYSRPSGDLTGYLKAMKIAQQVMDDEAAIERVAYDIAMRNYADGVRFLEVRFSPQKINMSPSAVVYSVIRGLKAAQVEHPDLEAKIILILMKHFSEDYSLNMASDIQKWLKDPELRDSIVGIDTAGKEIGYEPLKHEAAFKLARRAGLVPVSHAGESFRSLEEGLNSIWNAIHVLKAKRIGHALALGLDPRSYLGKIDGFGQPYTARRIDRIIAYQEKIANVMIRLKIAITICPTSNRDTGNIDSLDIHPILRLLELGLILTVNTDDPVTSATTLTEEFVRIGLARALSLYEIIQLIENGINYRLSNLR